MNASPIFMFRLLDVKKADGDLLTPIPVFLITRLTQMLSGLDIPQCFLCLGCASLDLVQPVYVFNNHDVSLFQIHDTRMQE